MSTVKPWPHACMNDQNSSFINVLYMETTDPWGWPHYHEVVIPCFHSQRRRLGDTGGDSRRGRDDKVREWPTHSDSNRDSTAYRWKTSAAYFHLKLKMKVSDCDSSNEQLGITGKMVSQLRWYPVGIAWVYNYILLPKNKLFFDYYPQEQP